MSEQLTNAQLALDLLADAAYVESRGLIHVAGRMRHAAQRLEGEISGAMVRAARNELETRGCHAQMSDVRAALEAAAREA